MNKFQEIKSILTANVVIQHYLGLPEKHNTVGDWYKSPFRKEKTASFCVSDKGIHDFGDSTHYDIISFTAKYFNTTQGRALEILSNDFNIQLGNEYENKQIIEIIKRQREEEKIIKNKINKWFNATFQKLCDEYQTNMKAIKILGKTGYEEALSILYKREIELDLLLDKFINAKEEEKEKLYIGRREINARL